MRIVSLLASATEIICALGLDDQLVAISHECDYPPEALTRPRVSRPRFDPAGMSSGEVDRAVRDAMTRHGGVYLLDEDALRELAPDLILTQAVCEVCAVPTSLAERARAALDGRPQIVSLDAHTVGDVLESILLVGRAAGVPERAAAYVDGLCRRLDAVAARVARAPRPRVLALEWLDPPFVPGHWTPEMIALAGGDNLRGAVARPSRRVSWDELAALDPDVLLLMPCGYKLEQTRVEADGQAARLVAVASRAVGDGRAFALNGSDYFNRSGPRMVDGVEILAAVLHPERFAGYELDGKAAVWKPNGT